MPHKPYYLDFNLAPGMEWKLRGKPDKIVLLIKNYDVCRYHFTLKTEIFWWHHNVHQQLIPTLTLPGYRNHSQPQHFQHSHSHKRSHHIQKDAADRLNSTLGFISSVYTSTPKHTCLSDVPLCRRTCALRRLGQQPAHCRAQLDEAYLRVSFHAHLPRTYSLSAQCTIKR